MKFDIYFMNSWVGYNSPDNWIYSIKHHSFISGLIVGINGFSHSPDSTTYRIVLFGFGIGINIRIKNK